MINGRKLCFTALLTCHCISDSILPQMKVWIQLSNNFRVKGRTFSTRNNNFVPSSIWSEPFVGSVPR